MDHTCQAIACTAYIITGLTHAATGVTFFVRTSVLAVTIDTAVIYEVREIMTTRKQNKSKNKSMSSKTRPGQILRIYFHIQSAL